MVKAVLFDLDDTLYDNTRQVMISRQNAISAMVSAGLKAGEKQAAEALLRIVSSKGSNFQRHYNELVREFNGADDVKIVAAGVVAYHDCKKQHMVPFKDTVSTLMHLRGSGFQIGVVTDGVPVKQWEKLIRLGLSDLFHTVVIAEGDEVKPSPKPLLKAACNLKVKSRDCIMVGDRIRKDILGGNRAGMKTAYLYHGQKDVKPKTAGEEPTYVIHDLKDILEII